MIAKICLLTLTILVMFVEKSFAASAGFSPQEVKQLYKEGEFDKVRIQLENFLKRADATATRDERILAYKYLGVVYASQPDGAPQAEAYFFRLLDLSPHVQLTELYVSSTVDGIFEKTKLRFAKEKQSSSMVDEFGHPITATQTENKIESKDSKAPIHNTPRQKLHSEDKGIKIWPWVLGAAAVGGGIGLYVMTSDDKGSKKETIIAGTPEN